DLSSHIYGTQAFGYSYLSSGFRPEPIGFVYTGNAGLVDIAHVRNSADMTRALYIYLKQGTHSWEYHGKVFVPDIPKDPSAMLDLAGAITYVDWWAHELITWEDFKGKDSNDVSQDKSSFSPEDLPSNMVGIELARRVIQAADYAEQSDDEFNGCVNVA